MHKNYRRPKLQVNSFVAEESILILDFLSNPTFDEEWDEEEEETVG